MPRLDEHFTTPCPVCTSHSLCEHRKRAVLTLLDEFEHVDGVDDVDGVDTDEIIREYNEWAIQNPLEANVLHERMTSMVEGVIARLRTREQKQALDLMRETAERTRANPPDVDAALDEVRDV